MNYTISKLAGKFNLSRSTLLYYDKIGLLNPEHHEKGEYRFYSEEDCEKLKQIVLYRKAGVSLKDIKKILTSKTSNFTDILQNRFASLNKEIQLLYDQQQIIAGLLKNTSILGSSKVMNKALWTKLLSASGLSDKDMRQWHITFEKTDPAMHHAFLKQLQIPPEEIDTIRRWK